MRLRDSFWALLGQREPETSEAAVERLRETIQAALLEQLGEDGFGLKLRVRFARDIEGLWYLRTEIMNALPPSTGRRQRTFA